MVNPEQLKSNNSFCLIFDKPILSGLMQSETVQGSEGSQSLLEKKGSEVKKREVSWEKSLLLLRKFYKLAQFLL